MAEQEKAVDTNSSLKAKFKLLHSELVKQNLTSISDSLFARGIISDDELRELSEKVDEKEQSRSLLLLLHKSGHPETFIQLRRAIEKESTLDHVVKQLDELTVDIEPQQITAKPEDLKKEIEQDKPQQRVNTTDDEKVVGSGHVFISYQWDAKSIVLTIRDRLRAAGFRVWIDQDNMSGSVLESMALAVENAAVVIVCMSQKYKDSDNCRTEAEYAFRKKKPTIPVRVEPGFYPEGWLGAMSGSKLVFDCSSQSKLEQNIGKLIAELSNHNKRERVPYVVHTLAPAEPVWGMTSVDDELYVVRQKYEYQVEVYNMTTYTLQRQLTVTELKHAEDMDSCKHKRCLYISDSEASCVHRVDLDGGDMTNWSLADKPYTLSVTKRHTIFVTFRATRKLKEFTTDGQPVCEIDLQADIYNLSHAVELPNDGQFAVSHGANQMTDRVHRVCKVDARGRIVQSYGGPKGAAAVGQLNVPSQLAVDDDGSVFVADAANGRILLLNPTFTSADQIASRDQLKSWPDRLHLDVDKRRLFVAVNDWTFKWCTGGRVVIVSV